MLAVGFDQPTHERACHAEHVSGEGCDLADAEHGSRRRLHGTLGSKGICGALGSHWPVSAGLRRPGIELGVVHAAGSSSVRILAAVVITLGEGGLVRQLVGTGPVDQRLEDGADADALLNSNGFDPCAPIVIESQAQHG